MSEQLNNQVPPAEKKQLPRTTVDPTSFEHELTEIYLELRGIFTPKAIQEKHPAPAIDRSWLKHRPLQETPTVTIKPTEAIAPISIKSANTSHETWDLLPITLSSSSFSGPTNLPELPSLTMKAPKISAIEVTPAQLPVVDTPEFHFSQEPIPVIHAQTTLPTIQIQVDAVSIPSQVPIHTFENVAFQVDPPTWTPPKVVLPNVDSKLHYEIEIEVEPVPIAYVTPATHDLSLALHTDWVFPIHKATIPTVEIDSIGTTDVQSIPVVSLNPPNVQSWDVPAPAKNNFLVHMVQIPDMVILYVSVKHTKIPVRQASIEPCLQFDPTAFMGHDLHFEIPKMPEPPDLSLPTPQAAVSQVNPVFFDGVKIMEDLGLIDVFANEGINLYKE